MKLLKILFAAITILLLLSINVNAQEQRRIEVAGKNIFLNGGNIAWVEIGRDIGPGETQLELFEKMFGEVKENGGNSMRFWLHSNGVNTPEFNGSDVVGPGDGAIKDLRDILDLGQKYDVLVILCLWSFDMLNINDKEPHLPARARDLLTQQSKLDKYIDNALIPMVKALKGHSAIRAWEIFNEPEGMSDEFGWKVTHHVPMADIQRFVNHTTSAIKNTDPNVLVTTGAWSFLALSDNVEGENAKNYYSDKELIEKGGKENGVLDFYSVHYYPNHFKKELSPFHNSADHWGLDKPIVVAEFYTQDTHGIPFEYLYENLYKGGYAGAMVWQWRNRNHRSYHHIYWPRALESMKKMAVKYPETISLDLPKK